jgi:hypothetical protein
MEETMKMTASSSLTIAFFSQVMGRKPRTDHSDRMVETGETVYDHFWGKDGDGSWTVSLKYTGTQPVPHCQLDMEHLEDRTFYALAGYCVINHIPCLISNHDGLHDLDPRYPYA